MKTIAGAIFPVYKLHGWLFANLLNYLHQNKNHMQHVTRSELVLNVVRTRGDFAARVRRALLQRISMHRVLQISCNAFRKKKLAHNIPICLAPDTVFTAYIGCIKNLTLSNSKMDYKRIVAYCSNLTALILHRFPRFSTVLSNECKTLCSYHRYLIYTLDSASAYQKVKP